MIGVLTDYVRTDIPLGEMVNIGTAVLKMDVSELQRFTYPDKYDIGNYKGMSIVQPANYEEEMDKLVNFLES